MPNIDDIKIEHLIWPIERADLKNEDERIRLEALIRRHQAKLDKLKRYSDDDVVKAIAAKVVERVPGVRADFYGPFGLGAERSFHLIDQAGATVASVRFRAGNRLRPLIVTDIQTKHYPEGSIGEVNRFNYKAVPLPETIGEIVADVERQIAERKA